MGISVSNIIGGLEFRGTNYTSETKNTALNI
jgi:hypothetical protein